jgi:DNA gyrase subunit A
MLPIPKEEKITSIVPVDEFSSEEFLVMLTKGGNIKKTTLEAFSNIRSNGLIAISLEEGDQLRWVRRAKPADSVLIGSRHGMAIHFRCNHEQLRPLGRATRGVKAMKLKKGDELVGMDILPAAILDNLAVPDTGNDTELEEAETVELDAVESEETIESEVESVGPWVLVITMGGYGKRVPVAQFRLQNRAGQGLMATKFKNKTKKSQDRLAALHIVNNDDEIMMVTNRGIIIRQATNAISIQSRSATGVRVQRLDEDDALTGVAIVPPDTGEETEEITEA